MAPSIAQDAIGAGSIVSPPLDSFHRLVSDLSRILGFSSGLNSSEIDVGELRKLMEGYISSESDWSKYALADLSRGYTRNLVDEGNGKSNLLVLVWTPGKGSPIHDHADAHCLMKVLKGSLTETRFDFPKDMVTIPSVMERTTFEENDVRYMSDDLGIHKISNPDLKNIAVSLHLYTPPNAARDGCNIFDEKTGERSLVTQSNFYSKFGRKTGA